NSVDRSRLEEREQFRVDFVLEGCAHAVRSVRIYFQCGALDDLGGKHGGRADWDDLVIVAVENERWHIEFLEILRHISFGECLYAKVRSRKSSHHSLHPE